MVTVLPRPLGLALVLLGIAASWLLTAPATENTAPLGGASDEVTRNIDLEIVAIPCPAGFQTGEDDDVCLAYNGIVPGPTFVFAEGESVAVRVQNRVAETIQAVTSDPVLIDRLGGAPYSMHRHGLSLPAGSDGVAPAPGFAMEDSTVPPGGELTYTFETDFVGTWHYHDHSMFASAGIGGESIARGLYGAFITLAGETTDHVFDLHITDQGVNGGLGLAASLGAGQRFDLAIVGLGERVYKVTLEDPDGDLVGQHRIGPGVSRGIVVTDAQAGSYTWEATTEPQPGPVYTGAIEVVA